MNKEKILQEIFYKVRNDLVKAGIPVSDSINPLIKISRAKRKWGSCKLLLNKSSYKFEISISEICFKEPDYIRFISNTMAHELIHTVNKCFNHGEYFKIYSNLAIKAGYTITTTSKSSVVKSEKDKYNEAKHILKCTKCGEMYYRFRFPKRKGYINRIRCGVCGGSLIKIK